MKAVPLLSFNSGSPKLRTVSVDIQTKEHKPKMFTVTVIHEVCEICNKETGETVFESLQVAGRGREQERNIIFFHRSCMNKKMELAEKKYSQFIQKA